MSRSAEGGEVPSRISSLMSGNVLTGMCCRAATCAGHMNRATSCGCRVIARLLVPGRPKWRNAVRDVLAVPLPVRDLYRAAQGPRKRAGLVTPCPGFRLRLSPAVGSGSSLLLTHTPAACNGQLSAGVVSGGEVGWKPIATGPSHSRHRCIRLRRSGAWRFCASCRSVPVGPVAW